MSEAPGIRVTTEAVSMLETRYGLAATIGRGRDVLEVGCGAGMGLGWLSRSAKRVVGGDYAAELLETARRHYGDRIPLIRLDAHALPFRQHTFDVLVLYEAIYYLARARLFVAEARRVLRPGGTLLVCSANREYPAFNPSPHSTQYWSAAELAQLLSDEGFEVRLRGGFAESPHSGVFHGLLQSLKRLAVALHLIPGTMKGREMLKRLFVGELHALPLELDEERARPGPLVPVTTDADGSRFKVVYAIGLLAHPDHRVAT